MVSKALVIQSMYGKPPAERVMKQKIDFQIGSLETEGTVNVDSRLQVDVRPLKTRHALYMVRPDLRVGLGRIRGSKRPQYLPS